MNLPSKVRIVEVGPRDGLQNETRPVPLKCKVTLIEQLAAAGLKTIECGSFVLPRRVPQMAGTAEVFKSIRRDPSVTYSALVPNLEGLSQARESRVDEIAVFVSASESFSRANINCSIEESLLRVKAIVEQAQDDRLRVRGYVSCVLGCPYEGAVESAQVARVAGRLADYGCFEVSLGDTIGSGTPLAAKRLLETVTKIVPVTKIAVHFHDTWGQALANILVSLQMGVAVVDSSVAGLGGCPFAPGAAGNVATEDVVYMLNGMGVGTGVDLKALTEAGHDIMLALDRRTTSKAALALGKN